MGLNVAQLPPYFEPTLTAEDRALIDRYLEGYLKLLDGRLPADTEARKHFIMVARLGNWPVTQHEAAFLKWQITVGWRQFERPIERRQWKGFAKFETAKAAITRSATSTAASIAGLAKLPASSAVLLVAEWYNAFLASDATGQLDRWLREVFSSKATIYDAAMDATYIKSHIGGGNHRLFDGGHDPIGAWHAVASASPNDNFRQEVIGYLTALWKDFVTPMGLPPTTFDKAYFDMVTHNASDILGISPKWLTDAVCLNAAEFLGAALAVVGICLGWSSEEKQQFAALAGSLSISSAAAANPLLAIVAFVCLVRAFQTARNGGDISALVGSIAKGGTGTAAFIVAGALISGPMWVTLIAGISASIAANIVFEKAGKKLTQVDTRKVAEFASYWLRGGPHAIKILGA
jgi:hypothetical protein